MSKHKVPKSARRASAIERADARVATAAAEYRETLPVKALGKFAELADQPPLFAGSIATLAFGLVARQPAVARAGLRMLATEAVATGMKAVVKRYVARTRPKKMLRDGRYALHADTDGDKNQGPWNSFPSGHTAGAVGVARAASRELPGAVPAAAAAVAAVTQVPTGKHFPSDVVAGALIGLAAEAVVNLGARVLRRRF